MRRNKGFCYQFHLPTKFQSSAYTPATGTLPFGIHRESSGTSGATIVLFLHQKKIRETFRRFPGKI